MTIPRQRRRSVLSPGKHARRSPGRTVRSTSHRVDGVRILSVQQPWAWAIVEGHKRVENRTWTTPYRGPVLIHEEVRWGGARLGTFGDEFRLNQPRAPELKQA